MSNSAAQTVPRLNRQKTAILCGRQEEDGRQTCRGKLANVNGLASPSFPFDFARGDDGIWARTKHSSERVNRRLAPGPRRHVVTPRTARIAGLPDDDIQRDYGTPGRNWPEAWPALVRCPECGIVQTIDLVALNIDPSLFPLADISASN